jgi:hypothetical protein
MLAAVKITGVEVKLTAKTTNNARFKLRVKLVDTNDATPSFTLARSALSSGDLNAGGNDYLFMQSEADMKQKLAAGVYLQVLFVFVLFFCFGFFLCGIFKFCFY